MKGSAYLQAKKKHKAQFKLVDPFEYFAPEELKNADGKNFGRKNFDRKISDRKNSGRNIFGRTEIVRSDGRTNGSPGGVWGAEPLQR